MQSFDRASVAQDYGEPLLYAMCALGARHIFFDYVAGTQGASSTVDAKRIPGEAWAERARQEVLREIHAPTIHHIMVSIQVLFAKPAYGILTVHFRPWYCCAIMANEKTATLWSLCSSLSSIA